MAIKLGSKVTDSVTGFTGIATSRTQYENGCVKLFVEARRPKNGKADEEWIDEFRLDKKFVPPPVPKCLGREVQDTLSRFSGIATSRSEDFNGSVRIGVTSRTVQHEGHPVTVYFDAQRLGLDTGVQKPAGGPGPIPAQRDGPGR